MLYFTFEQTIINAREEKHLSIRVFDARTKRSVYEQQGPYCHESFKIEGMDADHITSWSQGGKTIRENCQVLCKRCSQSKGCA
jgi:5-methylcytosine-specific restriction endonuclease McrA